jgi:hypothetical protein
MATPTGSDPKFRKGPKPRPRLPLSVFTYTGSSDDVFVHSPGIVHPTTVIDANVIALNGDVTLTQWKKEAGQVLGSRLHGVVLSLPGANLEETIDRRVSASE